jgi:lysine 2,3-aminomutase
MNKLCLHESDDPLTEKKYSPAKGIVHKYPDRVIFCPTYACPKRCDFCFRKNMVNGKNGELSKDEMSAAVDYIKKDKKIREVILSGGDPLFLTDKTLSDILKKLRAIPHVRLLRIHTRIPVTLPGRVTKKLAITLKKAAPLWSVLHINHPKEISADFKNAVATLRTANIPLLSQSVLLRGVNDNFEILKKLFYKLAELGIKPYYLHQCDPARGTKKYWVDIKKGKKIMRQLRKEISGICLPTYVQDSPHRGKTPLY